MKTTAMLTEMLHEERRGRINAEADLQSAKADVKYFSGRITELQENVDYLNDRNRYLMKENARLSFESSAPRNQSDIEYLQRRYDALVESMSHFIDPIVERIFNEDPSHWRRNKIPFIKAVREQTGLGLKESKDLVDNFLKVDQAQSDALLDALRGTALVFEPEED